MDLPAAIAELGRKAAFVVTIWNPANRYIDIRARLTRAGVAHIASFLHAAYAFPDLFLPHLAFDRPARMISCRDELLRAFDRLADDDSRDQFVRHVRFRLTLDFNTLPGNSPEKYFRTEFPPTVAEDLTFVDCGAFDGDTLEDFVSRRHGEFRSAIAIEPQADNFSALEARVSRFDPGVRARVRLVNAAIGEQSGSSPFHTVEGQGSFIGEGGSEKVDVVALDDLLSGAGEPLFIKFDIEGAEQVALQGAVETLRNRRPSLAVSAYHRPDDLWNLLLFIEKHAKRYRFHIRTEGDDGMGIVCYAFNEERR